MSLLMLHCLLQVLIFLFTTTPLCSWQSMHAVCHNPQVHSKFSVSRAETDKNKEISNIISKIGFWKFVLPVRYVNKYWK